MLEMTINGKTISARKGATVLETALENGISIPHLCWHPKLSAPGSCRLCVVQIEGQRKLSYSCITRVAAGMVVTTESPSIAAVRKSNLQFLTLNHPVDCSICNKSGECLLQDYHHAYNATPSISCEPKVTNTKFYPLSDRILLDNERCVLCGRCVRFTHEISGSKALGIVQRGEHSTVRRVDDVPFDDPYSDNVIDLCPVGALLSRDFLCRERVWQLDATPSVCPGCEQGCPILVWHRKKEFAYQHPAINLNTAIARVTPPNSQWICNKARDLRVLIESHRSITPRREGHACSLPEARCKARELISRARSIAIILSSWASNEELDAFASLRTPHMTVFVKSDMGHQEGEMLQDAFLIRAEKNPNRHALRRFSEDAFRDTGDFDLVIVWGEGAELSTLTRPIPIISLSSRDDHTALHASVHIPLSTMLERDGHFTNADGMAQRFERVFAPHANVVHATDLFLEWKETLT